MADDVDLWLKAEAAKQEAARKQSGEFRQRAQKPGDNATPEQLAKLGLAPVAAAPQAQPVAEQASPVPFAPTAPATGWGSMPNPGAMIAQQPDSTARDWANGPAAQAFERTLVDAKAPPATQRQLFQQRVDQGRQDDRQRDTFEEAMKRAGWMLPQVTQGQDANAVPESGGSFQARQMDRMGQVGALAKEYLGIGNSAEEAALKREQLGLQRTLGLGELAAKGQRLGLDTELGRGHLQEQGMDRLLRERLGLGQLGLGNKEADNKVTAGRENNLTELEKTRLGGEYALRKGALDNKGAGNTLITQWALQNAGDLGTLGGNELESKLDEQTGALRRFQEKLGEDKTPMPGIAPNAGLIQQLGGKAPWPAGQAPAGVAPAPAGQTTGQKKLEAVDKAREAAVPTDSFRQNVLGLASTKNGQAPDYTALKGMGIKGVLDKLGSTDLGRVSDQQMESVLQELSNAGLSQGDILTGLAKEQVRNARSLGDYGGRYQYESARSPWWTGFVPGDVGNKLTIKDPEGKPFIQGNEAAGLANLPQWLSGTLDAVPPVTGGQVKNAQRYREGLERMLDAARRRQQRK